MKKSISSGIIVLNLLVVVYLSLFCIMFCSPLEIKKEPPFIHQIDEITADGDYFYTLDNTLHCICKYSNEGDFQYAISFPSFGMNYIFINEEGDLSRYDLRANTIFIYGKDGELLLEKSLAYEDFKQIRDTHQQKNVIAKGVEYYFQNRVVGNSYVNIIHTNNETTNVIVETLWGHAVWNFFILAFLTGISYSIYQFACYFSMKRILKKG